MRDYFLSGFTCLQIAVFIQWRSPDRGHPHPSPTFTFTSPRTHDWNLPSKITAFFCSPATNLTLLICTHTYVGHIHMHRLAYKCQTQSFHLSIYCPSFNLLYPFLLAPSHTLARSGHSCRFSPNPAVLSCYNSSELEPSERGGSPTPCFHRLQHLDLRTSLLRCPVWGQGHIGRSKKSRHISLVKDNILREKWMSEW